MTSTSSFYKGDIGMEERKERLETFIKEELMKEAEDIQKEIDKAPEGQSMPEGAKERIWQNIQEEIAEYEREERYRGLSDEDYRALRLGQEMMEKQKEEKKYARKKRNIRFYFGLAAVLVLVLAVSMTSIGGAERVVRFMKSMVGDREIAQVDSSEDNLVIVEENEEEAYQAIKDEFGVEPVSITRVPEGMWFESMELDKNMQFAELSYVYRNEKIVYYISASYKISSMGIDVEDKIVNESQIEKKGCQLNIKEYETPDTKTHRYSAEFEYMGIEYFLNGTMEKEEFDLILKNLYFFP